ncbi:hypothetical protein PHMEG_0004793 [Phytophthora megakarya]|uniref:EF-hand domain-containing protein n=1 Tax=Phytophthora megakarya TaxID=4795 RepID=A0A225WUM9_9STRA|nr:hypothetical protein PHMEG_0004793 [Phytophthora megakarya]
MGGGVSKAKAVIRSAKEPSINSARKANSPQKAASDGRRESAPKMPTSIDARIVTTLRQLNLTRRADPKKGRATHFERIVLQFTLVRDAFINLRSIYRQFANAEKDGLDFEGLKAAVIAMGAEIKETDLSEIFYESDMVRDNSLSQNEFVVSLAIAHLLGLITNFDSIKNSLIHTPEDVTLITPPDEQHADDGSSSKLIAKALDLMVTAYLLFDNDASGTIQTSEVLEQMRQNTTGPNSPRRLERVASSLSSKAIRDERIKELDFDNDGTITFQEFVLTFQRWAGSDDDE